MSISLTGPTAAITTGALSAATYTFVSDMAIDNRSKAFAVSALGGTQAGVTVSSVDMPKQFIVKRPAQFKVASGYNSISGRFSNVPKNVTKVIGKGAARVGANQIESISMNMDLGIPAGAAAYDEANVRASLAFYFAAIYDQKEEIIQAVIDGLY